MTSLRITPWEEGKISLLLSMKTGEIRRIPTVSEWVDWENMGAILVDVETMMKIAAKTIFVPSRRTEGESPYICSLEYGRAGERLKIYFDPTYPEESRRRIYNAILLREEIKAMDDPETLLPSIQKRARENAKDILCIEKNISRLFSEECLGDFFLQSEDNPDKCINCAYVGKCRIMAEKRR